MLTQPDSILAAVERSERLGHLKRRVCRPLDKPLIPMVGADGQNVDQDIDANDIELTEEGVSAQ